MTKLFPESVFDWQESDQVYGGFELHQGDYSYLYDPSTDYFGAADAGCLDGGSDTSLSLTPITPQHAEAIVLSIIGVENCKQCDSDGMIIIIDGAGYDSHKETCPDCKGKAIVKVMYE